MVDIKLSRESLTTFDVTHTSSLYYGFLKKDKTPEDLRKEGWPEWVAEGYELYLEIHRFIGEYCHNLGFLGLSRKPLFFSNLVVDIDCRSWLYPECEVDIYFVCRDQSYCIPSTVATWKDAVDKLIRIVSCQYSSEITLMQDRASEELDKVMSRKLESENGLSCTVSQLSSFSPYFIDIDLSDGSPLYVYADDYGDYWDYESQNYELLQFSDLEEEAFHSVLDCMLPFLRCKLIDPEVSDYERPIYELHIDRKYNGGMKFTIDCHHPYWNSLTFNLYDWLVIDLNGQLREQVETWFKLWLDDEIAQLHEVKNDISKAAESIKKWSEPPIDTDRYLSDVVLG